MNRIDTSKSRRNAFVIFALLSMSYFVFFMLLDQRWSEFEFKAFELDTFLTLLALFFANIFFRYCRWHYLLKRKYSFHPFLRGAAIYISGFSYTATPGKVGELSRAIYYRELGVSSYDVVAVFVVERLFDLISVLILASVIFYGNDDTRVVMFLVVGFSIAVLLFMINSSLIYKLGGFSRRLKLKRVTRFINYSYKVSIMIRGVLDFRVALFCLVVGVVAWSLTACILVVVCAGLNMYFELLDVFSIYPVAMLAGAVSFIPGGFGATEAVIVMLLNNVGAPINFGTMVAITTRFFTLWLAMFIGLMFTVVLSFNCSRNL